ncbi:non-hydrolyzing UDP-N-acetylglucosamine 2-epimerase, partial [Clostridium tertium]|uniref:non-hydrolyzing UDP-N-acetylglucosamine 2-epimerase n=1 Tax=Clostridium tertium TaxID=1559 RepID=UPI00241FA1BF
TVEDDYKFKTEELNEIDYINKKVIMVTAHRRENWGEGIDNICLALKEIIEENDNVEIVYLVHLNPVVREVVERHLSGLKGVHLLPPIDTKETHNLINKCFMVMTDSGGLQEEAPHLGKPVLVLRDVTERPEAVEAGTVKLVGTVKETIITEANRLIRDKSSYELMSMSINPYGDGLASQRIVKLIENYFNKTNNYISEFKVL